MNNTARRHHAAPTERRAHARGAQPACQANRCTQGRTDCPCPQACELPATEPDPLSEEPATAMEIVGIFLAFVAFSLVIALGVHACARA